jgi:sugar O-acyltransferase (sialic acid O-acetyltransferase NeuD family)
MKKIAIYGGGGFGKEVRGMLELSDGRYSFAGFIDDFKQQLHALSDDEFDDVFMAIANPQIRARLIAAWSRKQVPFHAFISEEVLLHPSVRVGKGVIICPGVKATVDISIGDYSILNLNATIGHDVVMGEFCSIMPSVNISGNVKLGKRVFVGSGATILQGLRIGDDVIIGAGAVVTRNVAAGETMAGVPARIVNKIK